jgi:hypothetical protein
MRWKYNNGRMILETPLRTYVIYPQNVEGEIHYILNCSDMWCDMFYERADAKHAAEEDYRKINSKI